MKKANFKFYNLLIIALIFGFASDSNEVTNDSSWKLKIVQEDVSIYTRKVDYSRINELKIITTVKCDIDSIINVLDDIETYTDWMYGFRSGKNVKIINPNQKITYTVINFPDPLADRNMLSQTTIERDSLSGVVTFKSSSIADESYRNDAMVLITKMNSSWVLTPQEDGNVQIESYLFCDPAGNIPFFFVNRLLYRSPLKTVLKLRSLLEEKG